MWLMAGWVLLLETLGQANGRLHPQNCDRLAGEMGLTLGVDPGCGSSVIRIGCVAH